jgi:hypothetical protein
MKLRRRSEPAPVSPEFVELINGLYFAFEDNLERCIRFNRLRDEGAPPSEYRAAALEGARRIAYVSRVIFQVMANLMADQNVPESVLPIGVYGALARLAYALTALAEEKPDPETLLSATELDGLAAQFGIEDWVSWGRERNPDFPAGQS